MCVPIYCEQNKKYKQVDRTRLHLALELVVLVEVAVQLFVHLLAGLVAVAQHKAVDALVQDRDQVVADVVKVGLHLRNGLMASQKGGELKKDLTFVLLVVG